MRECFFFVYNALCEGEDLRMACSVCDGFVCWDCWDDSQLVW